MIEDGDLPNDISASKLSGTIDAARLPTIAASTVTGTLDPATIPDLSASKITTDILDADTVPVAITHGTSAPGDTDKAAGQAQLWIDDHGRVWTHTGNVDDDWRAVVPRSTQAGVQQWADVLASVGVDNDDLPFNGNVGLLLRGGFPVGLVGDRETLVIGPAVRMQVACTLAIADQSTMSIDASWGALAGTTTFTTKFQYAVNSGVWTNVCPDAVRQYSDPNLSGVELGPHLNGLPDAGWSLALDAGDTIAFRIRIDRTGASPSDLVAAFADDCPVTFTASRKRGDVVRPANAGGMELVTDGGNVVRIADAVGRLLAGDGEALEDLPGTTGGTNGRYVTLDGGRRAVAFFSRALTLGSGDDETDVSGGVWTETILFPVAFAVAPFVDCGIGHHGAFAPRVSVYNRFPDRVVVRCAESPGSGTTVRVSGWAFGDLEAA